EPGSDGLTDFEHYTYNDQEDDKGEGTWSYKTVERENTDILYYDLGGMAPEDMSCLQLLTDVMDELDTEKHTARELNTLRNTWLGSSGAWMDCWTGRQEGRPCHAKLIVGMSMLERSLEKAVELGSE
uniref:hypothetical protein n=1 Tax=Faecalibacterium prausnitzii TaxID=853 RepID=UPI003FEDDA05